MLFIEYEIRKIKIKKYNYAVILNSTWRFYSIKTVYKYC